VKPTEPQSSVPSSAREPALTLPLNAAVAHIRELIAHSSRPVTLIGITGPVGSGKSHLARQLSPCVLSTDDYLPNYDEVDYEARDLPHIADYTALAANLTALKRGAATQVPVWSFHSHRRESSREVMPHPLVVCEGIHALYAPILPELDIRIFIEAPADIRWSRWERLESSGERGWGVEKARAFFHEVANPTYAKYADTYRALAHIIVSNDSGGV